MLLRIILFSIAALLLSAHFFRAGNLTMAGLCLLAPLLFLLKLRWSLYLLQVSAYGAAAVWINAAIGIVDLRRQFGQPWLSAAAILGAVSLFTLVAGLLLNSTTIRQRYP
ncbi:MAG: hypothetical protein D4S02_15315 [Rhodocyclaceae bacterium]|nr:MAG: hypothetical protein D4S02_15315 [Rhodocyclaceae bacterium]